MGQRKKKRRRGSRRLTVLAIIVALLVLAEGALVASVFLVPGSTERFREVVADAERLWTGSEDSPGIPDRVGGAVTNIYRAWVETMWVVPRPEGDDETFQRCVSCHEDYATKRRFSSVYMDHPLHAQLDVACETCHRDITHPSPLRVEERVCSTCHGEVQERGQCMVCHPPASLPHFYLLGAPREGPVQCDACHPKDAFESTSATHRLVHAEPFDGSNRKQCLSCHDTTTCESCHQERHPANWRSSHGAGVAWGGAVTCYACHTVNWCSDSCHAATPSNPIGPKPLPRGDSP